MAKPARNGGWAPVITPELQEQGRELVREGWKSASNKFRCIVRVPPEFENARDFESWCIEEYNKHFKTQHTNGPLNSRMPDDSVKAFYARCHSDYPYMKDHQMTLSIDEYAAFRSVGGGTW